MFKILQYPNPRLKTVAERIKQFDGSLQKLIDEIFETHYATNNCAALAATQLDIKNPKHITVIDFSPNKNQPLCLINAEIIEKVGEHKEEEGCISVGDDNFFEKITRASKIKVCAQDAHGKLMKFEADGFMAKCIQHELDHLNGILFLDRLSIFKRNRVDKRLRKLRRQEKLNIKRRPLPKN